MKNIQSRLEKLDPRAVSPVAHTQSRSKHVTFSPEVDRSRSTSSSRYYDCEPVSPVRQPSNTGQGYSNQPAPQPRPSASNRPSRYDQPPRTRQSYSNTYANPNPAFQQNIQPQNSNRQYQQNSNFRTFRRNSNYNQAFRGPASSQWQSQYPPNQNQGTCGYCGRSHAPNLCPARRVNCMLCGKIGHFARVCRSGRQISQQNNQTPL